MSLSSLLLTLQGALGQGLSWGIMALGVYISFRLLDVADLSVDGTFSTGSCVFALLLVNGVSPLLAMAVATISGALAGGITGILCTKCKIPAILAGILTQLGLYSINLRILGRASQPLLKQVTLFQSFQNLIPGLSLNWSIVILGFVLVAGVIVVMYWFFGTEIGSALRATGNNEKMVRSLGVNTDTTKILGLMFANGLVALSGSLVAQTQGSGAVSSGTGAIVIGLAAIIIGEVFFSRSKQFALTLSGVVVGSIVYRIIVALVLQAGLNTDDLKLFSAILVGLALSLPVLLNKHHQNALVKRSGKEDETC